MIAQVTSGRLSSSTWLLVTKSASIFGATSPARFGFFSASPIHFTAGWRFATSPRNKPDPAAADDGETDVLGLGSHDFTATLSPVRNLALKSATAAMVSLVSGRSIGSLRSADRSAAV